MENDDAEALRVALCREHGGHAANELVYCPRCWEDVPAIVCKECGQPEILVRSMRANRVFVCLACGDERVACALPRLERDPDYYAGLVVVTFRFLEEPPGVASINRVRRALGTRFAVSSQAFFQLVRRESRLVLDAVDQESALRYRKQLAGPDLEVLVQKPPGASGTLDL